MSIDETKYFGRGISPFENEGLIDGGGKTLLAFIASRILFFLFNKAGQYYTVKTEESKLDLIYKTRDMEREAKRNTKKKNADGSMGIEEGNAYIFNPKLNLITVNGKCIYIYFFFYINYNVYSQNLLLLTLENCRVQITIKIVVAKKNKTNILHRNHPKMVYIFIFLYILNIIYCNFFFRILFTF
jgi:hypothetical protein